MLMKASHSAALPLGVGGGERERAEGLGTYGMFSDPQVSGSPMGPGGSQRPCDGGFTERPGLGSGQGTVSGDS